MAQELVITEGFVPFRGYRTWYRVVGAQTTPQKLPVVLLHGGPGVPSDCLEPLAALAETGRSSSTTSSAAGTPIAPTIRASGPSSFSSTS